jgi:enoyl-CoA hydratase
VNDALKPLTRIEEHDGAASVWLSRPERGNSLSRELVEELIAIIRSAAGRADLHTVVFCGEGEHFCTGFDLSEVENQSDGDLLHRFIRIEELLGSIYYAPFRTIALAAGRTWGAGADIVVACQKRFCDEKTKFRFPGAEFGVVLGSRRLAERVGAERARDWIAMNQIIGPDEARASGLVESVHAAGTDWRSVLSVAHPRPRISLSTLAEVLAATRSEYRDRDLAALVRSASAPGLKARMLAYSQAVRPMGRAST